METKELSKEQWGKSYRYAKKKYGQTQYLLDVPAKIGTMSYTYYKKIEDKTITVFYK